MPAEANGLSKETRPAIETLRERVQCYNTVSIHLSDPVFKGVIKKGPLAETVDPNVGGERNYGPGDIDSRDEETRLKDRLKGFLDIVKLK